MRDTLFHVLFVWYPYVCLSAFVFGSLIRFDRDPYTWKAHSSQMLRKKQLAWGSNLFHVGILFLLMGHTVGLLTPTAIYTLVITPEAKQLLAIVAGSVAGIVCFVGLSLLLHRRLYDARIRVTSTYMDLAVLIILWVQLSLGLITQRPSDLAEGVLSQCGTIISMRLNNDRDQAYVRAAMPEGARGFLDSIPALRNRECIICGEGVAIPIRVALDTLEEDKRPASEDPLFSVLWQETGGEEAILERVVRRWRAQGR
jgi:hypothetical protein